MKGITKMKLTLVLMIASAIGGAIGVAIEDFTRFSYNIDSKETKRASAILGIVAAIIIALATYFIFRAA